MSYQPVGLPCGLKCTCARVHRRRLYMEHAVSQNHARDRLHWASILQWRFQPRCLSLSKVQPYFGDTSLAWQRCADEAAE